MALGYSEKNGLADLIIACSSAKHFFEIQYAIIVETIFQHTGRGDSYFVAGAAEGPGISGDYADITGKSMHFKQPSGGGLPAGDFFVFRPNRSKTIRKKGALVFGL